MHYTYVLRSKADGKWYTGCTNDLRKRLRQHNNGQMAATVKRRPFELMYYEACTEQADAYVREKYLKTRLREAATLAEALTFHAFEIESIEGDVLDVKVTPNRGHDALSHRGIAKEISAILNIPLANDPLKEAPN